MNDWTVAILIVAASALLAAICYVRGIADYEKNVAEVRECQLAGGGDRECWRAARNER